MKQKSKPVVLDHERILSFLRVVRDSFPDATIVFTHGACFGLFQILCEVFPSATPYMSKNQEHIVTRIGGRYYDIRGEYLYLDGTLKRELVTLTPAQIEYWSNVVAGQRLEYMLKKYAE